MLKDLIKYPALQKAKRDNLNNVKSLVYLKTCRRKFILEYFNEKCKFTNCNSCDNCCNKVPLVENTFFDKVPLVENTFEETISKYEKYLL